ncbi:hypothetical protein NST18_12795 [Anoxybacillus sp. FSL W8-0104]|uniref:hypothetical protein n=1 Tax=Anoxybacillus sp. FSL W8-0104 TaxID=2954594 RepID=UPI000AE8A1D3
MADKNIQMTQRNASNTGWDNLFPVTKDSNVIITDPNNRFAGTKLDQVLDELFTFANDGKTGVATVVGSPATAGDTFSQLVTHIQNAKNTMATNLSNKGVSASGTEALQALADKIADVNTGKKWAVVSVPGYSKGSVIPITGLGFRPSICIFRHTGNYAVGGSYHGGSRGVTVTTYGTTHYSVSYNVSGLRLYLQDVTDNGCDVYVGGDGSSFDMLSVSGTAYLFS